MDSILVKAIQKATEILSLSNNNVMQALETVNAEMSQQRIDIAKQIAPQLTGGVEVDPQEGVDRLLLKLSNQLKDDDVVQFNGSSLQLVSSYILNQTIVGVHLVISHLMLRAETGVFAIEVVATFGKSLITLGVNADAIQIVAFVKAMLRIEVHLSAESGFLQSLDA